MAPYRNPSLPRALCDEVEAFIEEHPELGYRSFSEFTVDAVRRWLWEARRQTQGAAAPSESEWEKAKRAERRRPKKG